ncbi:MAG: SDR family NAD(P)-dependent oxidoreductase [Rickettsiales bacterium]
MFKVSVKGLVLFVTGVSKKNGIGYALSEEAIQRGAKKIYVTARNISQLSDLVKKYPQQITPLKLDVTNLDEVKKTSKIATDTDILINNAGLAGSSGCMDNYNEELAKQEMEINYFAPLRLMNELSKTITSSKKGAVVNIISIGGLYPSPAHVTYSASKAALYSSTQAARIEMKIKGINIPIFGVYPGPIATDMTKDIRAMKESTENLAKRVFDAMEKGVLDITTDELSDHFKSFLEKDAKTIKELKKAFSK